MLKINEKEIASLVKNDFVPLEESKEGSLKGGFGSIIQAGNISLRASNNCKCNGNNCKCSSGKDNCDCPNGSCNVDNPKGNNCNCSSTSTSTSTSASGKSFMDLGFSF
ncbi:MAG: hypothetical protein LIO93_12615 [Bacteroidales bacterium]|nr:hypothetical protein [Bacteroidales bacterium]